MINQGWECPRCKRIHAPLVMHCDCHVKSYHSMISEARERCSHEWFFAHKHPDDAPEKICKKCGINAKFVPCSGGWL